MMAMKPVMTLLYMAAASAGSGPTSTFPTGIPAAVVLVAEVLVS